ncbi:hypothetical protein JCM14036_25210 [Desulfotomaculum defluvii]
MKLLKYLELWRNYYYQALTQGKYVPEDSFLNSYYHSYSSKNDETRRLDEYMPEPYIGNFSTAKIAHININPGPIIDFQHWTEGEVAKSLHAEIIKGNKNVYDDWAKKFIYMDFENDNAGTKFMEPRVKYFESVLDCKLGKDDIVNMELYAWHSDKFGKLRNTSEIFREYILEPLLDTQVKYVFLLRKPIVEATIKSGINLMKIEEQWSSGTLSVYVGKFRGKIFIGTVNFMRGYPGNKIDQDKIGEIITGLG